VALKELLLREPRWTLAVAESLTCGQLQAAIGAISGASLFFEGGVTAYSLGQKIRHLGVSRAVAEPVNGVSAEIAEQMARGACRLFGTTLGAATTGYAEPVLEKGIVTPFAWWAICHQEEGQTEVRSGRIEVSGANRQDVQLQVTDTVINELIAYVRWRREK
jgi:nicotinamide-nucleotide amidase